MAKLPTPPSPLTQLFRENLNKLMRAHVSLSTQKAIERACGVPQSSIGRIIRGEQSPTLDMVYRLASAFDLEAWQMLVPDLEPRDPPITKQVDARQRELWQRFRVAYQELAEYKPQDR